MVRVKLVRKFIGCFITQNARGFQGFVLFLSGNSRSKVLDRHLDNKGWIRPFGLKNTNIMVADNFLIVIVWRIWGVSGQL